MAEFEQTRNSNAKERHEHEDVLHKISNHLESIVIHLRWLIFAAWMIFGFWVGWFINELT